VIMTVGVRIFSGEHFYLVYYYMYYRCWNMIFFSKRLILSFFWYIWSVHVLGLTNMHFIWILKAFWAPNPKCLWYRQETAQFK
jgi:hypothetical protein